MPHEFETPDAPIGEEAEETTEFKRGPGRPKGTTASKTAAKKPSSSKPPGGGRVYNPQVSKAEASSGLAALFTLLSWALGSDAEFSESDPEFGQLASALLNIRRFFAPMETALRVLSYLGTANPLTRIITKLLAGRREKNPKKTKQPAPPRANGVAPSAETQHADLPGARGFFR